MESQSNLRALGLFILMAIVLAGCTPAITSSVVEKARADGYPVLVEAVLVLRPDTVGGVDVYAYARNISNRTLKYLRLGVEPYNAVGDLVSSEIGGKTLAHLVFTGPFEPAPNPAGVFADIEGGFANVWYNSTIRCVRLVSVLVTYMDDSEVRFEGNALKALYVAPDSVNRECTFEEVR